MHKKKEGPFFRPAQHDEDKIAHCYNENKRLLSEIFRNQNKHVLIDSSTSSDGVEEFTKKKKLNEEVKAQIPCLSSRKIENKKEILPQLEKKNALMSVYFMPFGNKKVEVVEIPACEAELKPKSKFKLTKATKNSFAVGSRTSKLSATQTKYRPKI